MLDVGVRPDSILLVAGDVRDPKTCENLISKTVENYFNPLPQETEKLMLDAGVSSSNILLVAGDVRDPKTCENLISKTVEKWGRLDVLVNNAGVISKLGVPVDSEENFDYTFDVNLKSIVRLNKLAIPHLEKTKGNIVNISSINALTRGRDVPTFYALSKAALDHYLKYEAPGLAEKGIRMNNIA
uniref:Dehydrogenase/reductase SDR family member 11 n=1 Tax=Steinernema glaseri TaxID=37863 RepID=A0A1I7YZG7_9BILA